MKINSISFLLEELIMRPTSRNTTFSSTLSNSFNVVKKNPEMKSYFPDSEDGSESYFVMKSYFPDLEDGSESNCINFNSNYNSEDELNQYYDESDSECFDDIFKTSDTARKDCYKFQLNDAFKEGDPKALVGSIEKLGINKVKIEKLLYEAVSRCNVEIVACLLDIQAKNHVDMSLAWTYLIRTAIQKNHTEILTLLIKAGANVDEKDDYGQTPLHYAIDHGSAEIVSKLIDLGANIEMVDQDGKTPLHLAISCASKEIVAKLILAGADLEVLEKHWDAAKRSTKELEFLMEIIKKTAFNNFERLYFLMNFTDAANESPLSDMKKYINDPGNILWGRIFPFLNADVLDESKVK